MTPEQAAARIVTRPTPLTETATIGGSGITGRGLVAGIVGVAATCLIVSWAEIKLTTVQIGYLQMPPAVIGLLFFFLGFNAVLRRMSRRAALTPQDLTVAYCMMLLASMISSRGLMQKLLPLLVTANYLATDANDWRALFFSHIPKWAVPFDPTGAVKQDVAARMFERLRAGEPIPWNLWIGPLIAWSVLVLLVFGGFLCLAALLRRQWVDNEKLSFPLVQLPLEMVGMGDSREGAFLKNRLTWIGFALPVVVFLFKGLHASYPAVPDVTLEINLNDFLTTPPWSGIYYTPLKFSFAIVGFLFLLPTDLVFSLWFFFVVSRIQDVTAKAMNMDMPGMPMYPAPLYRGYQTMGAYLVLAAYLFWVARPHLRRIWRTVTGEEHGSDTDELLPYRVAFWGLWICLFGAGFWLTLLGIDQALPGPVDGRDTGFHAALA